MVAAGQLDQRRYNDKRFAAASPVSDWILGNAPSGRAVGFAGGWQAGYVPIYPAFGPDYGNSVRYVGPVVDGQVREYPTPRRSVGRCGAAATTCSWWGGWPCRTSSGESESLTVLDDPPEARWARAAGFTEVTRDGQFVLLSRRPQREGS